MLCQISVLSKICYVKNVQGTSTVTVVMSQAEHASLTEVNEWTSTLAPIRWQNGLLFD